MVPPRFLPRDLPQAPTRLAAMCVAPMHAFRQHHNSKEKEGVGRTADVLRKAPMYRAGVATWCPARLRAEPLFSRHVPAHGCDRGPRSTPCQFQEAPLRFSESFSSAARLQAAPRLRAFAERPAIASRCSAEGRCVLRRRSRPLLSARPPAFCRTPACPASARRCGSVTRHIAASTGVRIPATWKQDASRIGGSIGNTPDRTGSAVPQSAPAISPFSAAELPANQANLGLIKANASDR